MSVREARLVAREVERNPRAELFIVERGARTQSGLHGSTELNHILARGQDEGLPGFGQRVWQRARAIRQSSRLLSQVTYLVGTVSDDEWPQRRRLLTSLASELEVNGVVSVHASASASTLVLDCLEQLQLSSRSDLTWRAVFDDDSRALEEPGNTQDYTEERSGVRFARPDAAAHFCAISS